jgi:hypothetical protein
LVKKQLWCINLQVRDLLPDPDLYSAVTVKATVATEVPEGLLRVTVAVTTPTPRHMLSTETKGQTGNGDAEEEEID